MWWLIFSVLAVVLGYYWLIRPYQYWTKKGVPQGRPLPIFGDSWDVLARKKTFPEIIQEDYNAASSHRYFGTYNFTSPQLLIIDSELIKLITVKDFDHFVDHNVFLGEDADPLWAKNLFALNGQRWRDMRSTLSPAFTSSKMKYMFSLICQNGEQFARYFVKQEKDLIEVEMKDTFSRVTTDVVANIAFGVEVDSLQDTNNEFYVMGQEVSNLENLIKGMKMVLHMIFPKFSKYLGVRFFSEKVSSYFTNLVKENIASREKHGIVRPDMINLLMEAAKESENPNDPKRRRNAIDHEDITAQALIFFLAGFDTVSSMMCFVAYELAVNLDVQQRLIEEVDSCSGPLTYETLLGMKYLDMVISETLRKWPITIAVDRLCTKPYTIKPTRPGEAPVLLEEKTVVFLPIYGLHRDPKYFPDPDRFDPDRFSDENKININSYAYLPFGIGPRSCIGSRFALLEVKVLFFYLLSHFEIVPTQKTDIPIKISKTKFVLSPDTGFYLGFQRRA